MRKKIVDYAILAVCLTVMILFFANGVMDLGSGTTAVGAADATTTPTPGSTATPAPGQNGTPTPTPISLDIKGPTATPILTQTLRATPTPVAERLAASYTGSAVIIGENYDKSKLLVTAYFNNGETINLEPSEYTVSSDTVYQNGMNTIIIMYRDLTTTAHIYGRSLIGITVSPIKYEYGVGNMPDSRDLTVTGSYTDGSIENIVDEFEIYPEKLEKAGKQEITVTYHGKQAKCSVFARDWSNVMAMNVTFDKQELVTNSPINKNDFTVMVVYTDLTSERVTTYTMSRDIFYDSGKQPLTFTYGGVSKSIDVNVVERYVVGVRAEYTGGVVVVGRRFRRENMHVYIKYVDGEEVETDDYTVHNPTIRYIGNNVVSVYYGDKLSADVVIEGTEYVRPNFDYVSSNKATSGNLSVRVDTAVPLYLDEDCTTLEALPNKTLKKAYRKLKLKSGTYMAFDYGFVNDNDELELPLSVRVTIPEDFDIEHTFLYYCPNHKSILGRMNRKIINSRTFECTLFRTGTYMLVYSEQLSEQQEEE